MSCIDTFFIAILFLGQKFRFGPLIGIQWYRDYITRQSPPEVSGIFLTYPLKTCLHAKF